MNPLKLPKDNQAKDSLCAKRVNHYKGTKDFFKKLDNLRSFWLKNKTSSKVHLLMHADHTATPVHLDSS